MIDVNEMTVGQAKELVKAIGGGGGAKATKEKLPFGVGDTILIRTVTMIQLGRVKSIGRDFFVLEEGGWVADTARFSETLAKGTLNEFERAPSWIFVARGAVVDIYPWSNELPKTTK